MASKSEAVLPLWRGWTKSHFYFFVIFLLLGLESAERGRGVDKDRWTGEDQFFWTRLGWALSEQVAKEAFAKVATAGWSRGGANWNCR